MPSIGLDFYGVRVKVNGPAAALGSLSLDFSYFSSGGAAGGGIDIMLSEDEPPYGMVPAVKAALSRRDSISYDSGDSRYVDYNGKALGIYDYVNEKGRLFSKDPNLLHEISYLMILSRVGEMLDKKGLHRVHSCAFSLDGMGALFLMPQGGGKTTLYLEAAKREGVQLLGDDIPLLSKDMRIFPFPLRVGVADGTKLDIPAGYLGSIKRRRYGKKILIDTKYFAEKLSSAVELRYIFKGVRESSNNPRIVKSGRFTVFLALLRDCVAGFGLPQMLEYFIRFDIKDLAAKAAIGLSRTVVCLKAVFKAKTYIFIIGKDTVKNADVLAEFLKVNRSV